jgi:diguanylate cyclase (GGDEF)-like protein
LYIARVQLDSLAGLSAVVREIISSDEIDRSLHIATDAALSLLQAEHASIRLCVPDRLQPVARSGAGLEDDPPPFHRGQGVMGWAAATGQIARVADVQEDPRFHAVTRRGFAVRSVLCVPIFSAERVIGVLSMSSSRKGAFELPHEHTAFVLGQLAGQALRAAELERLATTDVLTHAFNRSFLMPCMVQEMNRAERDGRTFAVLHMDLDRFKTVNDRYGHAVGDAVLRRFADVVRACVRSFDVLIRRGGEEFELVMPGTTEEDAVHAAERIRSHLETHPVRLGALEVDQTVSIGVAAWNGREEATDLDERADRAVYEAKRLGRNRVVVAPRPGLPS